MAVAAVAARARVRLEAARGAGFHHVPVRLGRVLHVPDAARAVGTGLVVSIMFSRGFELRSCSACRITAFLKSFA